MPAWSNAWREISSVLKLAWSLSSNLFRSENGARPVAGLRGVVFGLSDQRKIM